jgi:hypothetical protein
VALAYRVGTVTATPPPCQLPHATKASLAELAANAAVSNEYGPATIISPSFRYSFLTLDDAGSGTSSTNPDADDRSSSAKFGLKTPEPAAT